MAANCVDRYHFKCYEEVVQALNDLQSNSSEIEQLKKQRLEAPNNNLQQTMVYLEKVGITSKELEKLSVIHVAGTKGKGSTCAYVESILRSHGFKTGFFSSPHLVAVRERIRINGQPIEKTEFVRYFTSVYNSLRSCQFAPNDMPAYFKFLTIMSFKVFLEECVDVVVLEVGIGGQYDCTNIFRCPVVCGITMLDLDHTSILGTTIESIAWHKAGIMKPEVPTFTVDHQPPSALVVMEKRAREIGCSLHVSPSLEKYHWGSQHLQLGLAGSVQYQNASLALQLSQCWLSCRSSNKQLALQVQPGINVEISSVASPFSLAEEDIAGLSNVVWPGRSQVIKCGAFMYFIDGAHTSGSMQACVEWYSKTASSAVSELPVGRSVYRILLFNSTGDRDPEMLLSPLVRCNFDLVIFTTNLVDTHVNAASDNTNYTVSEIQQHSRCNRQRQAWAKLKSNPSRNLVSHENCHISAEIAIASSEQNLDSDNDVTINTTEVTSPTVMIFLCIRDALLWLSCGRNSLLQRDIHINTLPPPLALQEASTVQVLVTGSLHLVGGVLSLLDPMLSCDPSTFGQHPIASIVCDKNAQHSTPGAP